MSFGREKVSMPDYSSILEKIAQDTCDIANIMTEDVPNEALIYDPKPIKAIKKTLTANANKEKLFSIITRQGEALSLTGIAITTTGDAKIHIILDNVEVDPDGFHMSCFTVAVNNGLVPVKYTASKEIEIQYTETAGATPTVYFLFLFERRPWRQEEETTLKG